jgi:nitrogen fixation NifU-like protein
VDTPVSPAVAALYDPVLVRHARTPYGRGPLAPASSASGVNRPCGDRVHFHTQAFDGRVVVRFEGEGCALALASASALCQAVDGQDHQTARSIAESFRTHLDEPPSDGGNPALQADLGHFLAVRAFPARRGCVRLAPDVLLDALDALTSQSAPKSS